jgi:hypothetical protein
MDVIESFINEGTRLKSEALLIKLLHYDLEEASGIL